MHDSTLVQDPQTQCEFECLGEEGELVSSQGAPSYQARQVSSTREQFSILKSSALGEGRASGVNNLTASLDEKLGDDEDDDADGLPVVEEL